IGSKHMLETARTTLAGLGAQRHSYVHAPASVKEAKKFHRDESSWLGSTSTALPKGLYPAVIAALQKDAPTEYDITSVGQDCRAVNAAQHLQVDFTPEGVMVSPRAEERSGWQWGMRLIGCGDGEAIYPVAEPELVTNGNRLEYRRGDLTEWYFNSPLGLEQGFTLQTQPDGPRAL